MPIANSNNAINDKNAADPADPAEALHPGKTGHKRPYRYLPQQQQQRQQQQPQQQQQRRRRRVRPRRRNMIWCVKGCQCAQCDLVLQGNCYFTYYTTL